MCAAWTIATSVATVFKILSDGKGKTLAPLCGKQLGILVSDRGTALKSCSNTSPSSSRTGTA